MSYPNELYHHGIKGMKWGVRRYQNKDGILTAAGKKRADRASLKNEKKQLRKDVRDYGKAKQYTDFKIDNDGRIHDIRNRGDEMLNDLRAKKGKKYADQVLESYERRETAIGIGALAGSAVAIVGYGWIYAHL